MGTFLNFKQKFRNVPKVPKVMKKKNKKIIVGISGGVDSSMALLLLKKKGWQPIGVSLKLPV